MEVLKTDAGMSGKRVNGKVVGRYFEIKRIGVGLPRRSNRSAEWHTPRWQSEYVARSSAKGLPAGPIAWADDVCEYKIKKSGGASSSVA